MTARVPMNKTSTNVKLEIQRPYVKIQIIVKPVFFVQLTPRPRHKEQDNYVV